MARPRCKCCGDLMYSAGPVLACWKCDGIELWPEEQDERPATQ